MAAPGPGDWDFSDYPYGLEPLTLPNPGVAVSIAPGSVYGSAGDVRRLIAQGRSGFPATKPASADDLERLFWFRWIIGHHISFVIWRLLADALSQAPEDEEGRKALAGTVATYVRAYCGMLLYTGSCTPSIYNATIRPSMYRLHSTFSGTWALDYPAVRSLFRGRKAPAVLGAQTGEVMREVGMSNQIHLGVSSKLVERGRSLLQQSIDAPDTHQPRRWGTVFDCYFLTVRAPVPPEQVLTQLMRRLKATAIDLATNGLYPEAGGDLGRLPEELTRPAVVECGRELTGILFDVAERAAALPGEGR
ncbi:hypothetical protein Nans01_43220 [Nocardiopsis ansamitocini]|uniref:Uncharacterized protein n=2 Tax=Nocardiopsis ansamitocini TaxID=1670832 RepID=A0A9W6PAI2_9ACTN|nr:hypothetical protein Nans01_43220 [Nocardiopsis ansamitocini]